MARIQEPKESSDLEIELVCHLCRSKAKECGKGNNQEASQTIRKLTSQKQRVSQRLKKNEQ